MKIPCVQRQFWVAVCTALFFLMFGLCFLFIPNYFLEGIIEKRLSGLGWIFVSVGLSCVVIAVCDRYEIWDYLDSKKKKGPR